PVEDRLDLVGGGVAGRAQTVARERVPLLAELGLGASRAVEVDHVGAEDVAAEARVRLRLLAAQPVVDVQRADAIAEQSQHVPQAGRVRPGGDEAADLAARLDQAVPANVLFDPRTQCRRVHRAMVAETAPARAVTLPSRCLAPDVARKARVR